MPSWAQTSGVKLGKPTLPTISVSLQREGPGPPSSNPLGPLGLPGQGQGWPHEPSNLSFKSFCGEAYVPPVQGLERARAPLAEGQTG